GDTARYALEHKLVDGLKTREEVERLLAERGVADEDAEGGFRQVGFFDYLRNVEGAGRGLDPRRPQVAVVVAEGEIVEGRQPPGGSAFASELIRREVLALKQADKPVVVSFGDVAASGGYWISMDADRIFADPSTITGSIGIFGLVPTFPRALDKIGVHTDGV